MAVVAVVALAVTGVLPRWPGLAQQVALPPLDLFADARVLVARASSRPAFAAGFAAALMARSVVLACVLGPSWRRLRLAAGCYALAAAPALVAAALAFCARAALYAWFFWAGLLVLLVTLLALGAVPWAGADTLASALRHRRGRARPGILLGYAALLALLGGLARGGGPTVAVAVVPLSAAATVLTARTLARPPRGPTGRQVAAVLVAAVLVVTAGVVATRPPAGRPPAPRAGSLLLVPGVGADSGSAALFRLDPVRLGYTCRQTSYYSYVGRGGGAPQGGSACPIVRGAPYTGRDTLRPLDELVRGFAAQVTGLPRPVVVVTHSQGGWIAWAALTRSRVPGVGDLVLLGPFRQSTATYPPPGRDGPGAVGGDALRLLVRAFRGLGTTGFDPDAPLPREMQATPGAIDAIFERSLPPGTRTLSVVAQHDLPLLRRRMPGEACPQPTTHTGLPTSRRVAAVVDRFLSGGGRASCPAWDRWPGPLTEAFGVPPS